MLTDPYAVLELPPGATPDEAARAYRRLAKRWHPDRAGAEAGMRMAELNAAFDILRTLARRGALTGPAAPAMPSGPGAWLSAAMRHALGDELLAELVPREPVELVTPAATWASPSTLLAVTDRRLLWLLDDAVGNRVRSLSFREITRTEHRLTWPLRRTACVRIHPRYGKPWEFADLRPATAARIAARAGATASAH